MNAIKLAPKVVPIKKLPKVKETNSENLGIVDQTLIATKKDNLGATTGGFLLGGIVPFLTFISSKPLASLSLSKAQWSSPKFIGLASLL